MSFPEIQRTINHNGARANSGGLTEKSARTNALKKTSFPLLRLRAPKLRFSIANKAQRIGMLLSS